MSYATREAVVMKDAISSGELKVGDWLVLNDGTGRNNGSNFYQIVDVNTTSNTAVLMGGVVQTDINWRDSDEIRVYPGGDLDNYLTGSFYNSFPAEYKQILVPKSIKYTALHEESSGVWRPYPDYITRSIFAPSASELGIESDKAMNEGVTFQWFSGNVNAKQRRTVEGVTAIVGSAYWTRTRNKASALLDSAKNYALYVKTNGDMDTCLKWNSKSVRPCINITMNCIVSPIGSTWWITPDLPPVFNPGTATQGSTFNDTDVTFTWDAATDSVEPSTHVYADTKYIPGAGGNVWYQVREDIQFSTGNVSQLFSDLTQQRSHTSRYAYSDKATRSDIYIRAVDKWGNYSDWKLYLTVFITNNAPPNKPGNITYTGRYKGERIALSWSPGYDGNGRLDQDNNFAGYHVYRSVDGGSSTLIKTLTSNEGSSYIDMSVGQWDTVTYAIAAFDEYDVESEKTSITISLHDRVTASISVKSNVNLTTSTSEESAPDVETTSPDSDVWKTADVAHSITFELTDSISDHTYDCTVSLLDHGIVGNVGVTIEHDLELVSGSADLTLAFTKEQWQQIPNGVHSINCYVRDNMNQDNQTNLVVYFKKVCNHIVWIMSGDDAVVVNGESNIDCYFLNIDKTVPASGFTTTVQVTRNANAASPDWKTATYNTGNYVNFASNQTQGNAFGVRVHIERTTPGAEGDCFLSSVSGVFGMNMFEKIAAQITAINTRIDGYHPAT